MVGHMSDTEIANLAAEPTHVTAQREELDARKAILEKAKKVFGKFLYPLKRDVDESDEIDSKLRSTKRLARKPLAKAD